MSDPLFSRVVIFGLGLVGSSLARVIKQEGLAETLIGVDASADVRQQAEGLKFCDAIEADPAKAVEGADLVVLATPVGAMGAAAAAIGSHLAEDAILTDVGSVKEGVIEAVGPHVPAGVHFIPGHPIAGTEQSGPGAGFAALFHGRWCILTPQAGTDEAALQKLTQFWNRCGSQVEIMEVKHHDLVLAITSHVPHLIAYNIVGTAADMEGVTQQEVIKYSAGGFRDFTRIAASDPTMWRDVFLANKDAVLEMLGRFSEDLTALQRAIRWGDGEALFDLFTRTRDIRRGIVEAGQETGEPDFGRRHQDD